ncbi:MAG TPA: GNAT family N-acetyltransferase [Trebonia sp.]|nr:GNAT family N-acetyltransferase [Trebonia sp.]
MTDSITLADLPPAQFRSAIGRLVSVYAAAMRPPTRMLSGRESILDRHAASPGFRALAAMAPARQAHAEDTGDAEPVLAGFIYGFHGQAGQWWHDTVAGALTVKHPPLAATWLANSFEVAELHVLPDYQGAGIGRRLLLTLTAGRPERTAVLSTQDSESRARRLYRGVGFSDLLTGFRFSGGDPPYAVMGAMLPLRGAVGPDGS